MTKPVATIAFSILLAWAAPVRADDYETAMGATRRGDYASAFKLLKPLAEKGDARAEGDLGAMYLTGKGIAADPKAAIKWLRAAADHGNASAQFNLGTMYLEGQAVMRDYKEAMKWNLLAADQGLAAAQVNIASMYYDGAGIAQDYKEAAKWLRLAADWKPARLSETVSECTLAGLEEKVQAMLKGGMRGRIVVNLLES